MIEVLRDYVSLEFGWSVHEGERYDGSVFEPDLLANLISLGILRDADAPVSPPEIVKSKKDKKS